MKKLTIRLDDYLYDELYIIADKENVSVNKVVANIIFQSLNSDIPIKERLDDIINVLNEIKIKQNSHFKLSKQHFVNQGYFENLNPKNDKCFNSLMEEKDNFNE